MTGLFHLRYRRDIPDGIRFASIRYPWRKPATLAQVQKMREAMPDPDRFEIVECDAGCHPAYHELGVHAPESDNSTE